MKKSIVSILFVATFLSAVAFGESAAEESSPAKNSVFTSFGGASVYYSVNYERLVYEIGDFDFAARAGVGTSFSSVLYPSDINFPFGISVSYGKKGHKISGGLSSAIHLLDQYDFEEDSESVESRLLFSPSLGYKFRPSDGGMFINAGFTPLVYFNSISTTASPWIQVGVGWTF